MLIKKLFKADCFFNLMVIETLNGEYKKFNICPFRKITEKDLSPLPYWNPAGQNGEEAESYMYRMYGLEKVK